MFRKIFLLNLFSLFLFYTTSCMTVSIENGIQKDEKSKGGSNTAIFRGYYWGSFYGFWWGGISPERDFKLQIQPEKGGPIDNRGLYRVVYTNDFLCCIISCVSFGTVVPIKVNWWLLHPQSKSLPHVKFSR